MATPDTLPLRPIERDDVSFLEEMSYLAAFAINGKIPDGTKSLEEVKNEPWFNENTQGWGRPGDHGFVAVDSDGNRIGAAWVRDYGDTEWYQEQSRTKPDMPTYQIVIAVKEGYRGQEVGTRLAEKTLGFAREAGIEVGLEVMPENNRVIEFYKKLGFTSMGNNGDYELMKIEPQTPVA